MPNSKKHIWGICKNYGKKIKTGTKLRMNVLKNHVVHCYKNGSMSVSKNPTIGQVNILTPQVQRNALAKFIIGADLLLSIGENV